MSAGSTSTPDSAAVAALAAPDAIVFFDGVCNLCNGAVQFILKREKNPQLKFAALQGETFRARAQHLLAAVPDSIILFEAGILYTESDAVLRISRYLRQPWRAMGFMAYAIPRFLRNPLYRFIARNRYRWFGKKEACYVPTPALRTRFLD